MPTIGEMLKQAAQSASNAVAGNVAGPVDLLNAGLGAIGLPVSKKPLGGSEWLKSRGLMADVPIGAPRIIGETLGMAGPSVVAAKAPQLAAGVLKAQANAMAPRTLNSQTGAIVWHGSPHKFDKFDSSKIGTGEGAQAYGHGLYLAESDGVAKQYADNVKDMGAVQNINAELSRLAKVMAADEVPGAYRKYRTDAGRLASQQYDEMMAARSGVVSAPGNMYKVDLPDDQIAKMLDWDKPLSQQAPEVQALIKKTRGMLPPNALDDLGGDLSLLYGPQNTGADFLGTMNSLQPNFGETALQRVGVPGVRYLDGGSRGAGSGTSNFVVFPGNESLLQILERNGVPIK
jgi:hypothetical protein